MPQINNIEPIRQFPNTNWEHFAVWQNVYDLLEALPNYFKSEIIIKGINVTDIYAVGSLILSNNDSYIRLHTCPIQCKATSNLVTLR